MATPQDLSEEGIACSMILERHHSSLSQSMTSTYTVVSICQILYSKRCVDESVLNEVEPMDTSLEDKIAVLLAAVKTKVFIDHRKLHELATVLDQFKETNSVANIIIRDYNLKIVKKAASEAVKKNIVNLKNAISPTFENIILTCEQEMLISSDFKTNLLDSSTNKTTRCSNLITHIQNLIGVQPAHLDTFLCILNGKDLLASDVANSVAKSYGYNLPKYERIRGVGGATSVISCNDNVEEMVSQYDQMSNEHRASDILRTHYSTLSQSLKDPVNIARLLHQENVITEDVVTQIDSADIKNRTTVLLRSARKAVHDNHQHLKVFGRVIQQLTAGNERVGQDILNDYNKVFPTKSIFSMTTTTATVQSSTGAEATGVRHHITRDMEEEFSAIRGKFAKTLSNIQKTLSKHNIPVDDVKRFCKFAFAKCSQEINDSQTMEDVLTFVANKCTLINISILRELIDDIQIDEAKQHIRDYQQAIDDFSQKMRARFPLNQSLLPDGTPHPLRGETVTFVIDRDPETTSLDDITDLQTYAFGKYVKYVKVIIGQKTNSIIITCSIPFEMTGLLMAEAMKNLKQLKKKYGLLKLSIGYCTIWNIRDEEEKEVTTDVQSTNEKVTSERERELEQTLQEKDKFISNKYKEVKELQENVDLLTEQLNLFVTEKGGNDAKEEKTVEDTSDITDDQQRDTELVEQTNLTIEELQQPLQEKEDQTCPSRTITPPSLSDTPSDKQILKQQIKTLIMENETLKSQLMKSKEEQISVEIKQDMEGKILSLSYQLREREEEVKQLSTENKDLQFQIEKHRSLNGMSDKVVSSVYSSLVNKFPPHDPDDTLREWTVEWDINGMADSVTLISPTPSDCITLNRQISTDKKTCEVIKLRSSSIDSTIILLSQLHQTNVKILTIIDTKLTIEHIHCLYHLTNINQLKYLHLSNTFLSASGGLHLLTDAISTNTSSGELRLENDRFTKYDMANISQALTKNTTLQRLHLMNCNITDDGLVQLSNGLTRNKTLERLDISGNNLITLTTAVCDIIHNSSLTHLYLEDTSLPSDSIPQLLDALSTNNTIKQLGIDKRHKEKCKQYKNYQHIQDRLFFR